MSIASRDAEAVAGAARRYGSRFHKPFRARSSADRPRQHVQRLQAEQLPLRGRRSQAARGRQARDLREPLGATAEESSDVKHRRRDRVEAIIAFDYRFVPARAAGADDHRQVAEQISTSAELLQVDHRRRLPDRLAARRGHHHSARSVSLGAHVIDLARLPRRRIDAGERARAHVRQGPRAAVTVDDTISPVVDFASGTQFGTIKATRFAFGPQAADVSVDGSKASLSSTSSA